MEFESSVIAGMQAEEIFSRSWANGQAGLSNNRGAEKGAPPRLLLVDDDPLFCKAVKREASKLHLDLTVCENLQQVNGLGGYQNFDVAILDFFFGDLTGFQLCDLLRREVPVILVSNSKERRMNKLNWPVSIRTFLPKDIGIGAILSEAMLTAQWARQLVCPAKSVLRPKPNIEKRFAWLWLAVLFLIGITSEFSHLSAPAEPEGKSWQWDMAPSKNLTAFSSHRAVPGYKKVAA